MGVLSSSCRRELDGWMLLTLTPAPWARSCLFRRGVETPFHPFHSTSMNQLILLGEPDQVSTHHVKAAGILPASLF